MRAWKFFVFTLALLALFVALRVDAQNEADKPETQTISQTGLLPVYGIDFNFESTWVDGARFPGTTGSYPHDGVNGTFQQVWETLRAGGFNVIRFPVDVRNTSESANRVANLCVWSRKHNVNLVPVLIGADRGKPLGDDFSKNVSEFVQALLKALRSGDGAHLEAYKKILAFQLENETNNQGLHGSMSRELAQLRLGQAARKLRTTEQEVLKDAGLSATPLMVNASFDYELIKARALTGAALDDATYAKSYESLKQFLAVLALEPDIDLIGVDWFAGSLSAGSVEKFPMLASNLTSDLPGKQIIFTTGFSTGFSSAEAQKNFYSVAFTNLADLRVSGGVESPFIGVVFREALNGKESSPAPPKPNLDVEMKGWDWAAKAGELSRMWEGQVTSEVMAWWLKRVENNMGLLTLEPDGAGGAKLTPQPALEGLRQIAETVSEAAKTEIEATPASPSPTPTAENPVPTPEVIPGPTPETEEPTPAPEPDTTDSVMRSALKEKAKQALMVVLDLVIERVAKKISGDDTRDGNTDEGGGGALKLSIIVAKITPSSPRADEEITFNIVVTNQSPDADASGLVVAIVDDAANLLAQQTDVTVGRGGMQSVELTWTPLEERTYNLAAQVTDSWLNQLANAALDPLTVAGEIPTSDPTPTPTPTPTPPNQLSGGTDLTRTRLQFGLPRVISFIVGTPGRALSPGQPTPVTLSLVNSYAVPLTELKATLFVDGKQVETRTVSTLLPRQNRSVSFTGVTFGQPGKHEVKVVLEGGGAKRLTGYTAKEVQVIPGVLPPLPPRPPSKVRSAVPDIVKVGGIVVPVRSGTIKTAPTISTPRPTPTPRTIATPRTTPTPRTTATPRPTPTPRTISTPRPTPTPRTTSTPRPTPTPRTVSTPRPTPTPRKISTPRTTATPRPTPTPRKISTPGPTPTPRTTSRPRPTPTPRTIATPRPTRTIKAPGAFGPPRNRSDDDLNESPQPDWDSNGTDSDEDSYETDVCSNRSSHDAHIGTVDTSARETGNANNRRSIANADSKLNNDANTDRGRSPLIRTSVVRRLRQGRSPPMGSRALPRSYDPSYQADDK